MRSVRRHSLAIPMNLTTSVASYKWDHMLLALLCLACFTEHHALGVRPRCSRCLNGRGGGFMPKELQAQAGPDRPIEGAWPGF